MTRFAWLQARTQTLVVTGLLAALAVAAAITGVHLSHLYNSLVANCSGGCDLATDQYLNHQRFLQQALDLVARVVPALIGIFWGTPLISREFETGTHRLVWTQGVTRARWVLTKLCLVGLIATAVSGLLTLTITWWFRDIDKVSSNQYGLFDRRDIAPIGYAVFAYAVGVLVGAVLKRTVPAMATTLGIFVFVRVAVALWVRPHLLSPLHRTVSLLDAYRFGFAARNGSGPLLDAQGSGPPNSWTLSSHLVNANGQVASAAERIAFVQQNCPAIAQTPMPSGPTAGKVVERADPSTFEACRQQAAQAFHVVVTYEPAGRYWTFQWLETGIFLGLAVAAVAGSYFWVTRRSA
jgi:hypothetical protein